MLYLAPGPAHLFEHLETPLAAQMTLVKNITGRSPCKVSKHAVCNASNETSTVLTGIITLPTLPHMTDLADNQPEQRPEPNGPSNADRPAREHHARDLIGDRQEATIIHAGECYRLRITANNKLILTK